MLTADLVDARKKNGELVLRPLDEEGRQNALALATALLETTLEHVGRRREELEEAWEAAIDAESKRFKLAAGLRKLVMDACVFEAEVDADPVTIRRVVFERASAHRQALAEGEPFDREAVLAEAAASLALTPDAVERAIFSDLKDEHVLRSAPALTAESLVEAWELGQAQAVLLAAVKVTCDVVSASPGLVRSLFAKLKFHKLLFRAERLKREDGATNDDGFRLTIDGPYSMFDSVTKYGLRLAIAFPALRALERWSLAADIRWGKAREALVFRLASERAEPPPKSDRSKKRKAAQTTEPRERPVAVDLHLADDVRELIAGIESLESGWKVKPATRLLDVPGQGLCIPDLELSREGDRRPIFVEVLGYWSRDAVWQRVELAQQGLDGAKVIFAVSSRLRVSAEVLDETAVPSCLYVYKGKMSPRAILDIALRLRARA